MQPPTLEYRTPQSPSWTWWWLGRLFVVGPLTGAAVGIVQTTAAMLQWIDHGQPNFFFRGWEGVKAHYSVLAVGGAFMGVAYVLVLWFYEWFVLRRVRGVIMIPAVLVFGFLAEYITAGRAFEQRKLDTGMLAQLTTVGFGLLIGMVTAKKP